MVTENQVKTILTGILSGTTMLVSDVMEYVERSVILTAKDIEPYVAGRKYPHWKHTVNNALHNLKVSGKITHHSSTKSYTF